MRWLAAFAVLSIQFCSAQVPSQRELNGFVIGQHRAVLEKWGEPYDEMETDDGWQYVAYLVSEEPFAYMTFKFPEDDLDHMVSIQITGDPSPTMAPFIGLRLGMLAAEVRRIFGAPGETRMLTDPPVEVWEYEDRNYSFEMDEGKLFSVQIFGDQGFTAPDPRLRWEDVQSALRSNDVPTLVAAFAPDAEIYRGDNVYQIDDSMAKTMADPTSEFRRGLALVVRALQSDKSALPEDVELRATLGKGIGPILKFSQDSPVEEIVTIQDAGQWRVWEIKLR